MAANTASLVRQAQDGSRVAFDHLVTRFRPTALRYASLLLRPYTTRDDAREAAQEVVQSAFLDAWQNLSALHTPEAFCSWLRRIVFKHWDRRHRIRVDHEQPSISGDVTRELPDHEPDLSTILVRQEEATMQARVLRTAIGTLPAGEQAAVILFYFAGCSHRDVAMFLNSTPPAVKSRLHSARNRLRERINNMSDEKVTELLQPGSAFHKNNLQITDTEREEVISGILKCYALFKQSYEAADWDETLSIVLSILTDDYELIFPADHRESVWDKQRVEQDIRKGKEVTAPRMRNTLAPLFEELLSVERGPTTHTINRAIVRATFITENVVRRQIIPRIDTFVRSGTEWKMQRTLSLAVKDK